MSETAPEAGPVPAGTVDSRVAARALPHPTDRPIPLWPEGILAAAATATLVVIALRHRVYLERKANELRRAVDEFQRQGGVEELSAVARQAAEFFK